LEARTEIAHVQDEMATLESTNAQTRLQKVVMWKKTLKIEQEEAAKK
jgi:hypothetical protein